MIGESRAIKRKQDGQTVDVAAGRATICTHLVLLYMSTSLALLEQREQALDAHGGCSGVGSLLCCSAKAAMVELLGRHENESVQHML